MRFSFMYLDTKTGEIGEISTSFSMGVSLRKYIKNDNGKYIFLNMGNSKEEDFYVDVYPRYYQDDRFIISEDGTWIDCLKRLIHLKELSL